jgi:hypothetical protein
MAGSIVSSPQGAEISERSSELVLPDPGDGEQRAPLRGREIGVSESGITSQPTSQTSRDEAGAAKDPAGSRTSAASSSASTTPTKSATPTKSTTPTKSATPTKSTTPPQPTTASAQSPRGLGLPGDRGPRNQEAEGQRPSFWRRIALGRRGADSRAAAEPPPPAQRNKSASLAGGLQRRPGEAASNGTAIVARGGEVTTEPGRAAAPVETLEKKVVEPMLQALVSVEAKLERSHTELVGRSDQVEQRLTQLWDIEEQLGTLGELQESLLQVSEQQRRLETAVVTQTRTLRWLVGAVFVSLAGAAFVVAMFLR